MKRLAFVALAATVLAGCQDVTQPDETTQPEFAFGVPGPPANPGPPDDPGPPDEPGPPDDPGPPPFMDPPPVFADEGFESYAVNSNIDGQGNWTSVFVPVGADGTGFFARDMEPIVGSRSGSLELRATVETNFFSKHFIRKSFENPLAGVLPVRNGHGSFVAVIPSTWNNAEVRKGFGKTDFVVGIVILSLSIGHDDNGVLRVRTDFGLGGDVVPVDEPVLFEVFWDNEADTIEWFMNGLLQVSAEFQAPSLVSGETAIVVGGSAFFFGLPTAPDVYDVLVDEMHLTLNY